MSVQAITWSLGKGPTIAAQAVLFSLANHADDWGVTYVGQETIAGECSCRKATVSDNLKRLEEAGLIARVQRRDARGHRTSDHVVLAPLGSDRGQMHDADKRAGEKHPEEVCRLARQDTVGVSRDPGQDAARVEPGYAARIGLDTVGVPEPSERTVREELPNTQQTGEPGWASLPEEMRDDALGLLKAKRKTGTRIVTEAEMLCAALSLAEFNRQLEREFTIGSWLDPVVQRIREHPSWPPAKHVRLVQSVCRVRWWEKNGRRGRPEPKVLWGNPKQFDRCAQDAADEAAGRERETDMNLRTKVWPDGRRWDELTAREQAHAKEAVAMGIRPWEERADAVPVTSNGRAITSFLDD